MNREKIYRSCSHSLEKQLRLSLKQQGSFRDCYMTFPFAEMDRLFSEQQNQLRNEIRVATSPYF